MVDQFKAGNEFLPYHPQASHVDPQYRDGWNHCYALAMSEVEALRNAAQAVVDRWDSPQWKWAKQGPTADVINDLRAALREKEESRG